MFLLLLLLMLLLLLLPLRQTFMHTQNMVMLFFYTNNFNSVLFLSVSS